jgi:recombinational DNA repair protein (RecF pathway)
LSCSFCGKTADHVRFLTAGASGGMICDRCWLVASAVFVKAYLTSLLAFVRPQTAR